ncbi:hypothetical protein [Streptomyces sp. SAI-127]|uniref:hypothetical protein n=1 Tax=Streptomyces sp. SAI-127 TaxID=2940543 RepID=UPI00247594CE|nr:hypothetical protein [Streptomyces sp. SAI-127]
MKTSVALRSIPVEGLLFVDFQEGVDADELADDGVAFTGTNVGETGGGVACLAEEA